MLGQHLRTIEVAGNDDVLRVESSCCARKAWRRAPRGLQSLGRWMVLTCVWNVACMRDVMCAKIEVDDPI